jgi:hypothetical protein
VRRPAVVAAAACALAACGGDAAAPETTDVVRCLEAEGASIELEPQVSHDSTDPEFVPVLTPETEVAAAGTRTHEVPGGDRELAGRCLDDPNG